MFCPVFVYPIALTAQKPLGTAFSNKYLDPVQSFEHSHVSYLLCFSVLLQI